MADELRGIVRHTTPVGLAAGGSYAGALSKRGELFTIDWLEWVLSGHAYQISNAAAETATAATTSGGTNLSTPFLYVGVPSGTTIVPLEIRLTQGGSVANDAFTVIVIAENAAAYSSGGTAITPDNLRTDAPNSSVCTCYSGATITAPDDDRALFAGIYSQNVADPDHSDESFFWTARNGVPPVIVGAGSLLIYAYVATTAPSLYFRVVWLELPTTAIQN